MAGNVQIIRRKSSRVQSNLKLRFDYWLLLAVVALLIVGMLMVFSTTFDDGLLIYKDSTFFLKRQFLSLGIGVFGIILLMQVDYHKLRDWSIIALVGTLVALIGLLILGEVSFGATRGLSAGSYQPSELAKLTTIIYVAHWLSTKGDRIKDVTYGLIPFAIITGVVCFLIVIQPDLSTAGLLALTCLTLFFIAGAEMKQIVVGGGMAGGVFLFLMLTVPYARQRVDDYVAALKDPIEGSSYQLRQVLIAFGEGGWLGVGLGEGSQKFGPLPAAHTDGVFAILGEEVGFVGAVLVMALFGLLLWRGIRVALQARDSFGFLLAIGVTCWLTFQALMNIAVVTAVMPFTGIPLPFLSYGGSSLVSSLLGIGLLLNISRDANLTRSVQAPRRGARPVAESVRENFDLWRRDRRSHLPRSGRRR